MSHSWWIDLDGVRCGLNYVLVHFEIAKTHLSEFHCYFNLICAALECGQDWQRQCSVSTDVCTWASCWECTNFLCTSDSTCHFLIMVWFPRFLLSFFFFTLHHQREEVKMPLHMPLQILEEKKHWLKAQETVNHILREIYLSSFFLKHADASMLSCLWQDNNTFLSIWKIFFFSL